MTYFSLRKLYSRIMSEIHVKYRDMTICKIYADIMFYIWFFVCFSVKMLCLLYYCYVYFSYVMIVFSYTDIVILCMWFGVVTDHVIIYYRSHGTLADTSRKPQILAVLPVTLSITLNFLELNPYSSALRPERVAVTFFT